MSTWLQASQLAPVDGVAYQGSPTGYARLHEAVTQPGGQRRLVLGPMHPGGEPADHPWMTIEDHPDAWFERVR